MGRKQTRRIRIATAKPSNTGGALGVEVSAFGLDGADYDRPYRAVLSPADAQLLAGQLTRWADWADDSRSARGGWSMSEWRVGPYMVRQTAPGAYDYLNRETGTREGAVETIPDYGLAVLPEGEVREETHGVPNLEAAAYYLVGYWNGRGYGSSVPGCVVDGCNSPAPDTSLCAAHRAELEQHPERFA